jgi:hypothetical protein
MSFTLNKWGVMALLVAIAVCVWKPDILWTFLSIMLEGKLGR